MRFLNSIVPSILLAAGAAQAASWQFTDAKVSVAAKKDPEAATLKFTESSPPAEPLVIGNADTLTLSLTTQENGKSKRPHQAFLVLREASTGLEAPFPLSVKENGKATVSVKHAELPLQFVTSTAPLQASVILASFGSTEGLNAPVFNIEVANDPAAAPVVYEKPLRYGKLEQIHHIFRDDPKSPPKFISAAFALAVVATVPAVCVAWLIMGGNLAHLPKAMGSAPMSHAVFFGSIIAMEGVFFMYYTSWNLFQMLPIAGVVGTATFLSGSKALGEVQGRRLAGER